MVAILQEIIELLLGGLTDTATALGGGLSELVKGIFLTGTGGAEDPYTLSVFGGLVVIFAGISLALGLCRWVVNFVTSLGERNS